MAALLLQYNLVSLVKNGARRGSGLPFCLLCPKFVLDLHVVGVVTFPLPILFLSNQ